MYLNTSNAAVPVVTINDAMVVNFVPLAAITGLNKICDVASHERPNNLRTLEGFSSYNTTMTKGMIHIKNSLTKSGWNYWACNA